MSKKLFLFVLMIVHSAILLPETSQERIIRKDLYAKQDNNALLSHQLIEPDLSLNEVVERNLTIMIEHKNKLQAKIDVQKSFTIRSFVPFCDKILAILYGVTGSATGLFTVGASSIVHDTWNGKNDAQQQCRDKGVEWASWFGIMNSKDVAEYNQYKLKNIEQEYPGFKNLIPAIPITAIVSVIAGVLFFKKMYTISKYRDRINACIKKIQNRFDRDQAVIAQLKNIKYELEKTV